MDGKNPAISAVIPTYNRADFLPRAIDSALNQTFPPREIIVLDDGSEDETVEILRSYGDCVQYVYQTNAGLSAATNAAVRAATSPWIASLDSDDYWDVGFLERISRAMIETKEAADVYFSDMIYPEANAPEERSLWMHVNFQFDGPYLLVEDGSDWALMPLQPLRMQASVIRRSSCLASGGMHEGLRVRNDQHFFLKIGLGTPMCAVKGAAVYVGQDAPNRLTTIFRGRDWIDAKATMYGELLSREDTPAGAKFELKKRYGEAFYGLSTFDARAGDYTRFLANLARGVYYYPQGALERLRSCL